MRHSCQRELHHTVADVQHFTSPAHSPCLAHPSPAVLVLVDLIRSRDIVANSPGIHQRSSCKSHNSKSGVYVRLYK